MSTQIEIALAAALVLGTAPAALAKGHTNPGGSVRPCSLDGVNPVHHPQIFSNAATAITIFSGCRLTPARTVKRVPDPGPP
jgi:hypothetical protein